MAGWTCLKGKGVDRGLTKAWPPLLVSDRWRRGRQDEVCEFSGIFIELIVRI